MCSCRHEVQQLDSALDTTKNIRYVQYQLRDQSYPQVQHGIRQWRQMQRMHDTVRTIVRLVVGMVRLHAHTILVAIFAGQMLMLTGRQILLLAFGSNYHNWRADDNSMSSNNSVYASR